MQMKEQMVAEPISNRSWLPVQTAGLVAGFAQKQKRKNKSTRKEETTHTMTTTGRMDANKGKIG